MWQSFSRGLARVEAAAVGSLILFAATMLCVQITARALFNTSFSWAEESVRYAIIWMVFLSCGLAFRKDAHISIDVLRQLLPGPARKVLEVLITLVCAVLAGLLVWYGATMVATLYRFGQVSPAMEAPMYWFYLAIPVSGVLMLVRLAESLVRVLRGGPAAEPAPVLAG